MNLDTLGILDISKLENVKNENGNIIAKCPACAEMGQDKKGNHLFINKDGKFGCVVYPRETGKKHRQRIYKLSKNKGYKSKYIFIEEHNISLKPKIIIKDVLGHLGQEKKSLSKKININNDKTVNNKIYFSKLLNEKFKIKNESIYFENGSFYLKKEINLIKKLVSEDIKIVHKIKSIFESEVISITK
ncbi:MAG: hypothetical protein GY817_00710 [bacterium]|nr:hypothetical protein [bacterium]